MNRHDGNPWENLPDEYFVASASGVGDHVETDYGMDAYLGRLDRFECWIEVKDAARELWRIADCGEGYDDDSPTDDFVCAVAASSYHAAFRFAAGALGLDAEEFEHAIHNMREKSGPRDPSLNAWERLQTEVAYARQFFADLKSGKFDDDASARPQSTGPSE